MMEACLLRVQLNQDQAVKQPVLLEGTNLMLYTINGTTLVSSGHKSEVDGSEVT